MKTTVLPLAKGSLFLGALIGFLVSACGGGSSASSTIELTTSSTKVTAGTSLGTSPGPTTLPATSVMDGALTDIRIENAGTTDQINVPVTFGQVFAQGDVPQLNSVTGKLSDGTPVPLQVDAKATYPDGSLRHGIISTVLPTLTLGQTQTIGLVKTAATATTPVPANPVDLTNAGFTASVNLNIAGIAYSASADSLLKAGKYTTWLNGPTATEWIISAPLTTAQGVAHPHLTAHFAIRSFTGLRKAKVDVAIENGWAYEPTPQNFTYDAQVAVGGQTVYSKTALTHFHHARWRKSFWWGADPQVNIQHNTKYLITSKAVPNYDQSIVFSSTAINAMVNKFTGAVTEPMGSGLAQPYMPTTGGRPDIGLLPGWAAAYLLTMNKSAKNVTLGTADLAGSWSVHYRDKNTDRPVSIVDYPYISVNDLNSGDTANPVTKKSELVAQCAAASACTNPNVADPAHQPSFAYLPYLVTGDYYYLEELQFWAMWNLAQGVPAYRNFSKGLIHRTQVRGQAWMLRALADAAYITPDNDTLKKQLETFVSDNLDWYNTTYSNNAIADNRLGFITEYGIEYNSNTGMAPWMDDFFTSAVGHIAELGYANAKPLLAWKIAFPISRMIDPNFCWITGASYSLMVRDSATSPIYTSIGQVYRASNSSAFTLLACGGVDMANNLKLKVGEMTGYSSATDGMPSDMQPALAFAADWGGANGSAAWTIFAARSVKPDYSSGPQFAVVPR